MKQWYLFYSDNKSLLQRPVAEIGNGLEQKLKRLVAELQIADNQSNTKKTSAGEDFPFLFALVPWGQHIEVMTRSKDVDEALFYLLQVIDKGLSRPALINCIKANLYEHQGKIVNNFTDHLPALQSKLVQEVLKENYDFGFAMVEHEIYDEAELERALTKNVTDLLLEMGTGFAFIGKQKELVIRWLLTQNRPFVLSHTSALLYCLRTEGKTI